MKKFLVQFLIFWLLPVAWIACSASIRTIGHKPYKTDPSVSTIITGDSHVQCAIDDSNLDTMKNISTSSECYLYSYYKLREIFEHNPNIRHLVLGFSYHNLSSYYDDYLTGEPAVSVLSRYVDVIDPSEYVKLVRTNFKLIRPILKKIAIPLSMKRHRYIGGFLHRDTGDMSVNEKTINRRIKNQYYRNQEPRSYSQTNIEYFYKILDLCKRHDVSIILLSTPTHPEHYRKIPDTFKSLYLQLIRENNLTVIDFAGLKLSDEHFMPDGDHLNNRGAALATEYFSNSLKNHLPE